jgi:ribonuclease VapC
MTAVMVDTSAAIALLTGEPSGGSVALAMERADSLLASAGTLVELGIVLEARLGPVGGAVLERFLRAARIEIVEVDPETAHTAIEAWRRFGRGRHPAGLDFGDCFTYAAAATQGAAVLCVGGDFSMTDIEVVPLA